MKWDERGEELFARLKQAAVKHGSLAEGLMKIVLSFKGRGPGGAGCPK